MTRSSASRIVSLGLGELPLACLERVFLAGESGSESMCMTIPHGLFSDVCLLGETNTLEALVFMVSYLSLLLDCKFLADLGNS